MSRISFLIVLVVSVFVFLDVVVAEEQSVKTYELKQGNFTVKVTNWGATIISVVLPDKSGNLADVVLGFDSLEEYKNNTPYFGALVGRVINRIGGAQFKLNGVTYKLDANEGNNTLHGGRKGFSHVIWNVRSHQRKGKNPHITLTYTSYDGDQGFPGTLIVSVTYMLIGGQNLGVVMMAKTLNKATPVNLAQHTYWNLGGHNSGDILSNEVQILSSQVTPLDALLIPTGKIISVKGTPYDFRETRTVGSRINQLPQGYNINYVIEGATERELKKVAMVYDKKSGREMELWTNAPGVQFYTANGLNVKGKGGYVYRSHAALCLETQGFPDAVNHPNFPSVIVNPGQVYRHGMLFRFSTK